MTLSPRLTSSRNNAPPMNPLAPVINDVIHCTGPTLQTLRTVPAYLLVNGRSGAETNRPAWLRPDYYRRFSI